jgi:hypothetical protein
LCENISLAPGFSRVTVEKKEKFSRFNGFSARVNPLKRLWRFGHRPHLAEAGC